MSEGITIKNSLGIYPYLMLILGVNGVNVENNYIAPPENQEYVTSSGIEMPSFEFGATDVTLQTSTLINDEGDVLPSFISSIVKEMKPLDADIAEFISENFWNLI